MDFAIIGAGMAGLACAEKLVSAGHRVRLFDKARGPGGRMSTRRIETDAGAIAFDHGAPYFTARDPAFCLQIANWSARGVVLPWQEAGADAWVGSPGMSSVAGAMAAGKDIHFDWQAIGLQRDANGWAVAGRGETVASFDGVILAIPAEQAVPLLALHDFGMAKVAMASRSQPCWTGMFAFEDAVSCHNSMIRGAGRLAWAARNNDKPGRSGPEAWVVQADGQWSAAHLEADPDAIANELLAALASALDLDLPQAFIRRAHRWRFAHSTGLGEGYLWHAKLRLGVCGDWLLGPRVECAWLSGVGLANQIG